MPIKSESFGIGNQAFLRNARREMEEWGSSGAPKLWKPTWSMTIPDSRRLVHIVIVDCVEAFYNPVRSDPIEGC